jgi:tRNA modification GTPase
MSRVNDTIAALASPAGTAALAIVRVSGPDTRRIAGELTPKPLRPRTARHADYRDCAGVLIDDVVLTFFAGPHSYSGEDTLEISTHGNPFIVQRVLEDLFARGCRPAEPGEFTQRAFLNGRMDLSQAEAVMDLIHARSERALAAANQQLRGALRERMEALTNALLGVLARVEAYIDFPDEDLPPEDRTIVVSELKRIAGETDRLLATSHYGEMLRDGIRTVIVGEPNVGKSTLLNRLVGRERAIVSPEPGTTRDFIEERIMVGPHCLRLVDTAGLNTSPAPLEKIGITKTHEQLELAHLVLLVLDASSTAPLSPEIARLAAGTNCVIALNKSDLWDGSQRTSFRVSAASARVSALTGDGMSALVSLITERADQFQKSAGEDSIAVNVRHAAALTEARRGLSAALSGLDGGSEIELIASDLRAVLAAFGEIVGKVDNERMLDQLFATFCIGK